MMNLYIKSYPISFPNYIFIDVVLKSYLDLYIKSYPTSFPNYIFIEVVLKSYLDKLYFHKLYDELMHQNCVKSYLKKYTESCTQNSYDEFRT